MVSQNTETIFQQMRRLQEFTEIPILAATEEILDDIFLPTHITKTVKEVRGFRKKLWKHSSELGIYRIALFSLVRTLKPKVVLETGVLHGFTSLAMLYAIEKNGDGILISIDLPSPFGSAPANQDGYLDTLPPNCLSGWVVGNCFPDYWDLRIGRSQQELKKIDNNRHIDIFVHDSEHTYENMTIEFNLIWEKMSPGGVLVADNVDANGAFSDFSIKVDRPVMYLPADPGAKNKQQLKTRVGVLVK